MWCQSRPLALSLLACLGLAAAEEPGDYRWPAGYEGKQKLEVRPLEPSDDGLAGYESEGFRFFSDAELTAQEWRSIMVVCEGLLGAMRSLPLDLIRPGGGAGARRGTVRIFADEDAYHLAGGLKATVGTFRPQSGDVLIWTRGLDEPDPEQGQFRLPKARQYDLLVHELAHQATGREFRRLPVWFTEGIAEYLAAAQFAPGRYSFKDPTGAIKSHVRKYLGELAKRDRFGIVPLESLLRLDGFAWAEDTRSGEGYGPFLKYASAVLLVHYFCHLDPARNHGEVVRRFLGALRDGRAASRATVDELLRGRSLKEIEGEIETFWQANGLRVEFRG